MAMLLHPNTARRTTWAREDRDDARRVREKVTGKLLTLDRALGVLFRRALDTQVSLTDRDRSDIR